MSDSRTYGSPAPLVLITGCSGLIGSRSLSVLSDAYRVVGLDLERPEELPTSASFIPCDLTHDAAVARALERVRVEHGDRIASVIHLAAHADFSGEPSPLYEKLTVQGTRRLLHALAGLKVEQFVFSSTLLVMKSSEGGEPIDEDSDIEVTWDYPESKLKTERMIMESHGEIPAVILRIAGVYDELGRSPAITEHIKRIHGKDLTSYFFPGDPERGQAFVHIDDLMTALELTVAKRHQLGPEEVFLISEPAVVPYGQLQDTIGEQIHGRQWPTIRIPKPLAKAGAWVREKASLAGEEPFIKPFMIDLADAHYPVDISRAKTKLGWSPQHRLGVDLTQIIQRMLRSPAEWYELNGMLPPSSAALDEERQPRGDDPVISDPVLPDASLKAHPWRYNPSDFTQRVPIVLLALLGFGIATYLSLYQWRVIDSVWDPFFGAQSQAVLDSDVSHRMRSWFLIPDAALGALAYLGDAIYGIAGTRRRWQYRPWMVVVFGLDVIPLGAVGAILVFLQAAVVGAFCTLCIASAVISLVMLVLAVDEVWGGAHYLYRVWRASNGDRRLLWNVFWSRPSSVAQRVAFAPRFYAEQTR